MEFEWNISQWNQRDFGGHGQDVISTFFDQQDTLIGLRHQLDEVKAINVEMYQKMQVQSPDRLKINSVCMSTVCETDAHSWFIFWDSFAKLRTLNWFLLPWKLAIITANITLLCNSFLPGIWWWDEEEERYDRPSGGEDQSDHCHYEATGAKVRAAACTDMTHWIVNLNHN